MMKPHVHYARVQHRWHLGVRNGVYWWDGGVRPAHLGVRNGGIGGLTGPYDTYMTGNGFSVKLPERKTTLDRIENARTYERDK